MFTLKNEAGESMEGDGGEEEDDFQTDEEEEEEMEMDKQVQQKRKKVCRFFLIVHVWNTIC